MQPHMWFVNLFVVAVARITRQTSCRPKAARRCSESIYAFRRWLHERHTGLPECTAARYGLGRWCSVQLSPECRTVNLFGGVGLDPELIKIWFDSKNVFVPIGQARLKIEIDFLHGTWTNLSFANRQTVENTFLISMTLARTVKKYGPCAVVSGVKERDGTWPNDHSCGGVARRAMNGIHCLPYHSEACIGPGCAGVRLPNIDPANDAYAAVVQAFADGKGHADYILAKRSVSQTTERMCRWCDCTSQNRSVPYDTANLDCPLRLTTMESHERDIELVMKRHNFSQMLGCARQGASRC